MWLPWLLAAAFLLAAVWEGIPGARGDFPKGNCRFRVNKVASSFADQKGKLPFPCLFHAARMLFETRNDTTFKYYQMDVYAKDEIEHHIGQFFVGFVRVMVTLKIGDDPDSLIDGPSGTFEVSAERVRSFLAGNLEEGELWQSRTCGAMAGRVVTGYSDHAKAAQLDFTMANSVVLYRAVNRSSDALFGKPLAILDIKSRDETVGVEGARFPDTFCSDFNDTQTFTEHRDACGFENMAQFLIYTAFEQNVPQCNELCEELFDAYAKCNTTAEKKDAVKGCSQYLNEEPYVECLDDQFGVEGPLETFKSCISLKCSMMTCSVI